jgi:hypothetical protein
MAPRQQPPHPPTDPSRSVRLSRRWGPTEAAVLAISAVLVAIGIAGFFVTDIGDFAHHDTGDTLLGFEVNTLHNLVHLGLGLIGLVAWTRRRSAIGFAALLAVAYGGAALYGVYALGEQWDVLSLNEADNWLHLALAVAGALVALLGWWQSRHEGPGVYEDDEELVIDLTSVDDRLRDVMPTDFFVDAPARRRTGLPLPPRG